MNKVEKTGINEFVKGEPLTANQLNALNNTINKLVDAVNYILQDYCDINKELGVQNPITLVEAVEVITEQMGRRSLNMKIRFIVDSNGNREEYFYNGSDLNETNWTNTINWVLLTPREIDGGEW